jgi:3-oxoacyl-[acyl-carrier-protein] synthase II
VDKRIVITGIGMVTSLGHNVAQTWQGLVSGANGVDYITLFDTTGFETRFAAEVKDFKGENFGIDRKDARRFDRSSQFAIAAALEAVKQAKLEINDTNRERVGVIVGSGIGGIATLSEAFKTLHEKGPTRISPFAVPLMLVNMPSGLVAIQLGAKGPNFCPVSACSSSAHAIGEAAEIIRRGDADVILAGGTEAGIVPISIGGFGTMHALSERNDNPKKASRPFDAKRDGFVMGEGAGVLVIENLAHAQARGATILAEVTGYGNTNDAFHIVQTDDMGDGAGRAMQIAMKKAGLTPQDIDYINAHGTSTQLNEKSETRAIKTAFGKQAYEVSISSTKSMTGHTLGAAGAIEAIVCVKAINEGIIPPTINHEFPDPDCDLDITPNVAKKKVVRHAMSNSAGFGGHNVSLIVSKFA